MIPQRSQFFSLSVWYRQLFLSMNFNQHNFAHFMGCGADETALTRNRRCRSEFRDKPLWAVLDTLIKISANSPWTLSICSPLSNPSSFPLLPDIPTGRTAFSAPTSSTSSSETGARGKSLFQISPTQWYVADTMVCRRHNGMSPTSNTNPFS